MKINRPLSPHLSVYRPQLTSTLSIFHRISGGFLVTILFSTLFLFKVLEMGLSFYPVYLSVYAAPSNFEWFLLGIVNLVLVAFCYHLSNGVRHLLWDFGIFLDLSKVRSTGVLVLLFSSFLLIVVNILLFSII